LYDFCKDPDKNKSKGFSSCDALCMACILDSTIILETRKIYACVEQFGVYAAGHMISDWHNHFKRQPNVEIVTAIDKEKYQKLFELSMCDSC